MANFEDVSSKRKSEVWQNFLYCKSTEKAKCNLCQAVLKASGSSTKGLITHLKFVHKIAVKSCMIESETSKKDQTKMKVRKIGSFFKSKKPSLDELLSQLTAVDGLTFNQIAKSERIHRAFKADGYDLPRSHKQVRDLVIKHSEKIRKFVKEELMAIKQNNGRFSITLDESTSTRNRRYMNINVHFQGGFRSLGVIRIQGSMNAAKAIKLVEERLESFGLNLNTDVVATVTDGASLMVKLGKETSPHHVTCYAHGIHLAVCDVLYKKAKHTPSVPLTDENCSGSDTESATEDEDEDEDDSKQVEVTPVLSPNLQNVVKKVRKTVKIFRRSPVKNDDNLQPFVLETFGKEKMLLLDCKTRWNSLLTMLERFYELRKEIKLALLQLDIQFDLSDAELKGINDMCEALAPFKAAVDALSGEEADLLLSEKIIAFIFKKLEELNSEISNDLKKSFRFRIDQRRNVELVHLFGYLKNPSYIDQPQDQLGHKIKRQKIAALATNVLQRLFPSPTVELDRGSTEQHEDVITKDSSHDTEMTLAQELHAFVAEDESEEAQNCDVGARVMQKEMLLYEASKKRPENLNNLYAALKSIKPTSVEAERAFSALGYFASKIRNRLNDDTLDALMFLRQYYNK